MFKKQLVLNRQCSANKVLHRTAIPLRSIAAGELGRYASLVLAVFGGDFVSHVVHVFVVVVVLQHRIAVAKLHASPVKHVVLQVVEPVVKAKAVALFHVHSRGWVCDV